MTNNFDIKTNIAAAMAALAVSSTVILGTVGPVQANNPSAPVQLLADQANHGTPSARIV